VDILAAMPLDKLDAMSLKEIHSKLWTRWLKNFPSWTVI
jgi:hypothetical protein